MTLKFKYLIFLSLILLVSCISPIKKQEKAAKAVEKAKINLQLNENDAVKKAIAFLYGADFALSLDAEPSKYSIVAKRLTGTALLATGSPSLKESLEFQKIISSLLSTNEVLRKEGEYRLQLKNKEIIGLQDQIKNLEEKLSNAEDKAKQVAENNSVLASKFVRLVHFFWFFVYGVIGIVVFRTLCAFLPPPYSGISGILDFFIGGIFKLFSHAMPKVKEYAGVVSKETHQLTENTLSAVVQSVQRARQDSSIQSKIDPILLEETASPNHEIRSKIIDVKKNLGHI